MIRKARKRFATLQRPLLHALVLVGLIPKFLVPLGYMPAAIADGGPLMLCDAFAPMPAAATAAGHGHGHAGMHGHGPQEHGHAMGGPSTGGETTNGSGNTMPQGAAADPDGKAAEDDHHEWKRCSLGGLAALAAITTEWHLGALPAVHERLEAIAAIADTRIHRFSFRSRAPPLA